MCLLCLPVDPGWNFGRNSFIFLIVDFTSKSVKNSLKKKGGGGGIPSKCNVNLLFHSHIDSGLYLDKYFLKL